MKEYRRYRVYNKKNEGQGVFNNREEAEALAKKYAKFNWKVEEYVEVVREPKELEWWELEGHNSNPNEVEWNLGEW